MARPDPNTPFSADELAKLPAWAQGKVKYLNGQLVGVLEQLATAPATPASTDTPTSWQAEQDAEATQEALRQARTHLAIAVEQVFKLLE